jgi:hypothetical protein
MLALPDLEAETKAAINQYIRDSLGKPAPASQGIDPFNPRAAAESMLGTDLVSEWIDGGKKEGSS